MHTLLQSVFIQALGYAIVNSLVQMALLWLLMQVVLNVFTTTPRSRYHIALITQLTGFTWFVITCCRHLSVAQNTSLFPGYSYAVGVVSPAIGQGLSAAIPWLSVTYLLLLIIFVTRWVNGYYHTTRLQNNHCTPAPLTLQQFVSNRSAWMGITRHIQVFVSEKISSPLTTGFIRPLILIPLASINHLSTTQLEAVLLHELAHIRRLDFVWNIILTIIETILFFNPFTWLIGKRIATEREYSCDDWVLQYNYQPMQYAEALLNIARLQSKPALALAAVDGKQQLTLRIKRMLGIYTHKRNYGYSLMALAGIAVLFACLISTQKTVAKTTPVVASRILPVPVRGIVPPQQPIADAVAPNPGNAPDPVINNKSEDVAIGTNPTIEMIAPPAPETAEENNSEVLLDSADQPMAMINDLDAEDVNDNIHIKISPKDLAVAQLTDDISIAIPVKDLNIYKEVLRLQVGKIMQQVDALRKRQVDSLANENPVTLQSLQGNSKKLLKGLMSLQKISIQHKKDGSSVIILNERHADAETGNRSISINTIQ